MFSFVIVYIVMAHGGWSILVIKRGVGFLDWTLDLFDVSQFFITVYIVTLANS
jgi:hypothetical protein